MEYSSSGQRCYNLLMFNYPIILVSLLATILLVITFFLIIFTQNYIQQEGQKVGLCKKEIKKWQFKAVLFGCIFGLLYFKKTLNKKNKRK